MAAYLPWLFLLACPLMTLFMMRGRGGAKARPDPPGKETGGQTLTPDQQTYIEQLENEVADLRATGTRRLGGSPPGRR
jgi:hypothetical protein